MSQAMKNRAPEIQRLADVLDEALKLLDVDRPVSTEVTGPGAISSSLFEQCIDLCGQVAEEKTEAVRTLHHLSCTGGTLITKCLAAMPNTSILNEVDPLSTLIFNPAAPNFTPTDVISLVRQGLRQVPNELVIELFLQNLALVRRELASVGKRLILRDHSHSHFLHGDTLPQRPTLRALVARSFHVHSILTVRDPVDSFLALSANQWIQFEPATFDEYCRRYLIFLDKNADVTRFCYEDFVSDPENVMKDMCSALHLKFSSHFLDVFDVFRFSGDSGRSGSVIEPRTRRGMGDSFVNEARNSRHYAELIEELNYPSL